MKNPNANHNFCDDSSNDLLGKGDFLLFEVEIKIAHGQKLHNDVDILLILKGFSNTRQKILMANATNDLALKHIKFSNLGFLNDLHCILLPCFFIFRQGHTSKSTLTEIALALIVLRASTILSAFGCLIAILLRIFIVSNWVVAIFLTLRIYVWISLFSIELSTQRAWFDLWTSRFFTLFAARYITHNWYYAKSKRKLG